MLSERGILCAPDYVINAGGLMNVWVELQGYDPARALKPAGNIYSNLRKVFSMARDLKITTSAAADRIAEERLGQGARVVTHGLSRDGIVTNAQTTGTPASLVITIGLFGFKRASSENHEAGIQRWQVNSTQPGNWIANGMRSRITFALVSSKIRWGPRKRYWMSSGSLGSTARMLGGTVDSYGLACSERRSTPSSRS
jgi:hypothetical protein